jgi:hypothetical protein
MGLRMYGVHLSLCFNLYLERKVLSLIGCGLVAGAIFWPDYWGDGCSEHGRSGEIFKGASRRNSIYTHAFAGLEFKVRDRRPLEDMLFG